MPYANQNRSEKLLDPERMELMLKYGLRWWLGEVVICSMSPPTPTPIPIIKSPLTLAQLLPRSINDKESVFGQVLH